LGTQNQVLNKDRHFSAEIPLSEFSLYPMHSMQKYKMCTNTVPDHEQPLFSFTLHEYNITAVSQAIAASTPLSHPTHIFFVQTWGVNRSG